MLRLGSLLLALAALAVFAAPLSPRRGCTATAHAQPDDFVNGVIVDTTNPNSMRMAREAGFTHAKMILYWPRLEPSARSLPLERDRARTTSTTS